MSELTQPVLDVIGRFEAQIKASMARLNRIGATPLSTSDHLWDSLSIEQRALQKAATEAISQLAEIRAAAE